jgi:acyl-CoA thioester hydrolase
VAGTGEVRVRVWIEKLGTTSMIFGFCVMPMDQDVDHATGTRALVRIDKDALTPTPWTENFRHLVGPYVRG